MKKIALGIRPFTRIVWKSKEAKTLWAPRLNAISALYNNAEWETLIGGSRRAATIQITLDSLFEDTERIALNSLIFLPIAKSACYSGFSHRHIPPKPGESFHVYGVIARNKEDAIAFRKVSNDPEKVHYILGEMLGYPKCCIEAFNERWKGGSIDPIWEAALATKERKIEKNGYRRIISLKPSIYCNQMLRYFGARITSHLPCSFDCNETERIGKKWAKKMREIDKEAFSWLKELLTLPLRWDAYRGILEVQNKLFLGVTTTGFTEDRLIVNSLSKEALYL